jgi:RNA polymerase-interacting CarD/CdnL/TRCF family regulator
MSEFKPGDWIVHLNYGVGQIQAIEERTISGEDTHYFKIKTHDTLLVWVPVSDAEEGTLRGLTPASELDTILAVFDNDPVELPPKSYGRQSRIQQSRTSHSLIERARFVRDLCAHRETQQLGLQERKALKWAIDHLVAEWALMMDKRPQEVQQRLDGILKMQTSSTNAAFIK